MLFALLFSGLVAPLSGCLDDDPPPLFVDMQYQLRCIDCMPQAQDNRVRDLMLLDGESLLDDKMDVDVQCRARKVSGQQEVSFSIEAVHRELSDQNFALSVEQARVGGGPGPDCLVLVTEGSNSYEGSCIAGMPREDAPCQLQLELEGGTILGELHCERIPNRGERTFTRHLVFPLTKDDPAPIEIQGCEGL